MIGFTLGLTGLKANHICQHIIKLYSFESDIGAICSCAYLLVFDTSTISNVLLFGGLTGAGQPSCPWPNLHNEFVPAATASLLPAGQSQALWMCYVVV